MRKTFKGKYAMFPTIMSLIIAILLFLTTAALAQTPPALPASLYGTVQLSGANVPTSTVVSTWFKDVKVAETSTFVYRGRVYYRINVPADDPATPEIEGGTPGDVITFTIGDTPTTQTAIWRSGTNTRLNLTAKTK